MKHITVWDLPLRIFHWALVILLIAAIVTAKIGGNALEWHVTIGLSILGLLIFRVLWGFIGGKHAKFSSFIRGPKTILAYIKGQGEKPLGHNPVGALSVIGMLLALFVQAITGLFATDAILTEGPLYSLVDSDSSDYLTSIHTASQYAIYAILALHIAAIVYYRVIKKDNLVLPMLTGRKKVSHVSEHYLNAEGSLWKALILAAASYGAVWVLATQWK